MRPLFTISVALADDGTYIARTVSHEGKQLINDCTGKRLPTLMKTVSSRVSKRRAHNIKFPPPPPSRIIRVNGAGDKRLIIPARN